MRNRLEANLSMMLGVAERSAEKQTLTHKEREQNSRHLGAEATNITAGAGDLHEELTDLVLQVLDRSNMMLAYDRVCRNKGAPGIDGMTVGELKADLKIHWPTHKQALLNGIYQPQPVRKVSIPKPGGGQRQLGIPTVLDRLIQQALHQVLISPLFESQFSNHSYGFRPGSGKVL